MNNVINLTFFCHFVFVFEKGTLLAACADKIVRVYDAQSASIRAKWSITCERLEAAAFAPGVRGERRLIVALRDDAQANATQVHSFELYLIFFVVWSKKLMSTTKHFFFQVESI